MDSATLESYPERAQWLLARHPWAASIVHRVVGYDPVPASPSETSQFYPDDLAAILSQVDEHALLWERYAEENPAPWGSGASEADFDAWEEAGPRAPDGVRRYNVLSSGEKGLVHTLALQSGEWITWSPEAMSGIRYCPDGSHTGECPGLSSDIWDVLKHQARHG